VTIEIEPTLERDIRKGQIDDEKINEIKELIKLDKAPGFKEDADGTVRYSSRVCVPNIKHICELILKEAHETAFSIHPGSEKMYQDLKQKFWWYGMKRDVAKYVALCDICQRANIKSQPDYYSRSKFWSGSERKLYGTSWDKSLPYAEFSYNKMSPFQALYGRRCRTALHWDQSGEKQIFGSEIIEDAERQV
ncbi:LOW QUALITY PROTEIN: hypothetical protein U9M48_019629, partial [Paspalum notatum var. saurae]